MSDIAEGKPRSTFPSSVADTHGHTNTIDFVHQLL